MIAYRSIHLPAKAPSVAALRNREPASTAKKIMTIQRSTVGVATGALLIGLATGGVMGEVGATYIYGQTPDGWRIHATIGHDAETAIGCLE